MLLQTKEIAEIFGVSPQAVNIWARSGCPKVGRGQWDVAEVVKWWAENIYSSNSANEDEGLAEAKRRYWSSKADREKLRVSQEKSELIKLDDVHIAWARRAMEYKSACTGLVNALPPLLEGKSQPAMRKTIDDHVWAIFDRVTRTGRFCKTQS